MMLVLVKGQMAVAIESDSHYFADGSMIEFVEHFEEKLAGEETGRTLYVFQDAGDLIQQLSDDEFTLIVEGE